MKKLPLFALGIAIIVGSVYGLLPNLFPDTATFPRVPIADGTIGGAISKILATNDLANYAGDGTVPNTDALSGITSSGYLKYDIGCLGGQKYIGVDANGARICGNTTVLLTDYGTIESQGCAADYYRSNGTTGKTASGDTLKAGDVVKTAAGCPMTIIFADYSLLRIDGDTTVSLDLGSLADGTTIASAIVANGSVWGRILSETGSYNIGTDVLIVGVRGTSVLVEKPATPPTISLNAGTWQLSQTTGPSTVKIVHSTNPTQAGTGICMDANGPRTFPMQVGANIVATSSPLGGAGGTRIDCGSLLATPLTTTLAINNYISDIRIAKNSIADLKYLNKVLRRDIPLRNQARINSELGFTRPLDLPDKDAICPDITLPLSFWDSLMGTEYELCQPSNILAFANYGTMSGSLYTSGTLIVSPDGTFSGANQPHLRYTISPTTGLLGPNWTATLNFTIGSTAQNQSLFALYSGPTASLYKVVYTTLNGGVIQVSGNPLAGSAIQAPIAGLNTLIIKRIGVSDYTFTLNGIQMNPVAPAITGLNPDTFYIGGGVGLFSSTPWIGTITNFTITIP